VGLRWQRPGQRRGRRRLCRRRARQRYRPGGADSDTLLGQAGADAIGGGAGFDYLYGGAGADVFVFNRGDSFDTAWDFNAAEGDRIRLDPAFGISTPADLQSRLSGFTFEGAAYTVISFAESVDQLTIKGIAPTDFTLALLTA
jgi:Ca2+-binding RTX toxin-like protein